MFGLKNILKDIIFFIFDFIVKYVKYNQIIKKFIYFNIYIG